MMRTLILVLIYARNWHKKIQSMSHLLVSHLYRQLELFRMYIHGKNDTQNLYLHSQNYMYW